ncbi:MAG: hypothetical protein LBD28_05100 [Tannerellaceae bacterium]|jgi:hypothetical protein|nr:hypothetical protein [Tannerellaceae bacterium]
MKHLSLIILFTLACLCGIQAQVTIGANREAHPGAVLELESSGNKGLLMPVISLTDASVWGLANPSVEGMIVFNENSSTANGLKGKGLYVWTRNRWRLTLDRPCSIAPAPGTPAGPTAASLNKPFVYSVPLIEGATYKWTLPADVIGQSNTNTIDLVGIKAGQYSISVEVSNSCGTGKATASITIS